ncbi:Putative sarcosine oxidase, partial [Toxocara canis]
SYDVIVVGSGIVGSCTAYHLAKYKKRTLLIEQFRLCHSKGSSHGASRIIRHAHDSPIYLPLVIDAYKQWKLLQETTQKTIMTQCGLLWIGCREETKKRSEILKKFSIDHEILIGNEIRKKFPHLVYDSNDWWALYEKSGGVLHAENCLQAVQERYKELGGEIHEEEEVKNLNVIAGQITQVVTNRRTYIADKVVFTIGSWLPTFFPGL